MMTTASVKVGLADGSFERFDAVYMRRGRHRDVYEVLGRVGIFGERVVLKLARPQLNGAMRNERDALQSAASGLLPKLHFFGATVVGGTVFEVLITTRGAASLDVVMDYMKSMTCCEKAALYIGQLMLETLHLLLYGFEEHGVSFGSLLLADVCANLEFQEFMELPEFVPVWDVSNVGRCSLGVVCVDAQGVKDVELQGRQLYSGLRSLLSSWLLSVLALRHPSWQLVVQGMSRALLAYIADVDSKCNLHEARKLAVGMATRVREAISFATRSYDADQVANRVFGNASGVTPQLGGVGPMQVCDAAGVIRYSLRVGVAYMGSLLFVCLSALLSVEIVPEAVMAGWRGAWSCRDEKRA
jgi:hypothetical protein